MTRVNLVLKAIFAGLSAFLGTLIGATQAADMTWADISLNTWLVAASAALGAFTLVYYVPNSETSDSKPRP